MVKKRWALLMPLTVSGNTKEIKVEPVKILEAAIEKLGTIDAGDLDPAVPDLISILSASMMVDDLTTNGFGLAIIQLSESILGRSK